MKTSPLIVSILSLIISICLTSVTFATPGGIVAGTTFYLKVSEKSSTKVSQFSTKNNVPVFSGAPNFRKGQKVRFEIGKNGSIIAKGMDIPIVRSDSYSNIYLKQRKSKSIAFVSNGQMSKDKNEPDFMVLTFTKTSGSGFGTAVHLVSYTFE